MTDPQSELADLALSVNGASYIAPCFSVTLYFLHEPVALLQETAAQLRAALGAELTHFNTGTMRGFARLDKKFETVFAGLFDNRRVGEVRHIYGRGGPEECTPARLDIFTRGPEPVPATDMARAAAIEKNRVAFEVHNSIFAPTLTEMVVTFPLTHPLAEPGALLAWFQWLACIQQGAFVGGHAGYGVNQPINLCDRDANDRLGAILTRHPGLTVECTGIVVAHLLKYWPGHAEFLPRVRRANWLTLVHPLTIDALLGGRAALVAALSKDPAVRLYPAGAGLLVQAGPAPGIGNIARGDKARGDDLPHYRHVARVLRPARMARVHSLLNPFTPAEADAWLAALDSEHA